MSASHFLSLPYLAPAQAQKHVTVNEALRQLDSLLHIAVIEIGRDNPPEAPQEGDRYIVSETPANDWIGHAGAYACFVDGAWIFANPQLGWVVYSMADQKLNLLQSEGWASIDNTSEIDMLGINASSDTTNRLSVAAPSTLFTHEGDDHRVIINKQGDADTASLLFQNNYEGRCEIGLMGDDALSFKVSADGANFTTALSVDSVTAKITTAPLNINNLLSLDHPSAAFNWNVGQDMAGSFYLQRSNGGFGAGGRVLQFSETGALGLWGAPLPQGKVSVRSNVNADGTGAILYLEQTALSQAAGVMHLHNRANNATPMLRCSTDTQDVFSVNALGAVVATGPVTVGNYDLNELPSASSSGAGAIVYVTDAVGGSILAFSDGQDWRRSDTRMIIS